MASENDNTAGRQRHKGSHILFLVVAGIVYVALAVVFLFFPRTRFSELEKRDLAEFPSTELLKERPADYTAAISHWFSDSEPFRDEFMTLSMYLRGLLKQKIGSGDDAVSFIPAASAEAPSVVESTDSEEDDDDDSIPVDAVEQNAKIASAGIVIVGEGPDVRALMAFGGGETSGKPFIDAVNEYKEAFPDVNVYAMPVPTAIEFYLPQKAAKASRPQKPTIDYVRDNLRTDVKFVDVYSALRKKIDEPIYLRTDHHWAPLGAFYGARALAKTAGVPFRDLDSYEPKTVHRFVGSMYGYSKDISVKNAPEDFVYYVPQGVDSRTTYITYGLDKNYNITSQRGPYEGKFFHPFKDGSGGAYLTFMGGDQHTVKVKTSTPGNRRVLIIKDSYGNPVPSFLFYSWSEIHVVDFRYFPMNMKQYVADNGITDIVFAFNVYNICSSSAMKKVKRYLTQSAGIHYTPHAEEAVETPAEASPNPVETTDVPFSKPAGVPDPTETPANPEIPSAPQPQPEDPVVDDPVQFL